MTTYKKIVPENSRITHVSNHSKNGKQIIQKSYHSEISGERNRQITHIMSPAPNDKSLSTGSQIKFYVEANTCRIVKRAKLRFQIGLSVVAGQISDYPPCAYWFDRIEFYIRDTGVEIGRLYSDVLHMISNQYEDDKKFNYHYNQSNSYNTLTNYDSKRQSSPVDQYFYLPLDSSFMTGMDLDLSTITTDIEIRLHPKKLTLNPNDSLKEIALIIDEVYPDAVSHNSHMRLIKNHVISHTYLDTQHYQELKTLAASTKYTFDLDMFHKKAGAILVCIRPQNYNGVECLDLGDGKIDIVDVNGSSILGGGRSIVYDHYIDQNIAWANDYFKKTKQLLISFTNPKKILNGVLHGYHQFDQSKMKLEITTPPAQTVDTYIDYHIRAVFDPSVLVFRFTYKNKRSPNIPHAATVDQIRASWNSLMNEFGFQCTGVSNTFTNITNPQFIIKTMTGQNITKNDFDEIPSLEIFSTNTNSWQPYQLITNQVSSTAQWSSVPVPCEINIYSLQLKIIEQNGSNLSVFDLV